MSLFTCPECKEKISLKDKKCSNCNKEFSKQLKNKIFTIKIIAVLVITFLILGIVLYFIFKTDSDNEYDEELLSYGVNYYMAKDNNYYIKFFKKTETSGTCYMQVSTENCNYEIDDDKVIVNFEMTSRDVKIKGSSVYKIIDKNNLKRVEISIGTKDINPAPASDDTLFTTDYASTEKQENTLNAPYYKKYSLAGDSKNPKATIEFLSSSVCDIDFSNSSKSIDLGRREYMHIKYNKGLCTYEKLNDYDFKIQYTGTFSIIYPVVQMNVYNIPVFSTPNNEMRITFEEGYNSFKITNGIWDYSNSALYFKDDTFKEDDSSDNDDFSNDDVSNDKNTESSNNDNKDNYRNDENKTQNSNQDTPISYKYEYRYRDKKEEVTWSNWSDWSENKVSATENREVETREEPKQTYKTIYKYKHYICPTPKTLTPYGNSTPYDDNCSGGYWEYVESEYVFKKGGFTTDVGCNNGYGGYYDYKKYSTMTKKEQCWFQDVKEEVPDKVVNVTEYRYRTKSIKTIWGDWSDWSSTEYKETNNRQVEVRRTS